MRRSTLVRMVFLLVSVLLAGFSRAQETAPASRVPGDMPLREVVLPSVMAVQIGLDCWLVDREPH